MDLISFPFRIEPNASVATVEDGTDEGYAQEIAVMCMVEAGERELVPDFGITDPAFMSEFDIGELSHKITLFQVPVTILSVDDQYISDGLHDIVVNFDVNDLGSPDYDTDNPNVNDTLNAFQ